MAQQFRTGSIEITEAGRSADGLGQLLRVGLTLSDQDGEQPATGSVAASVRVESNRNAGYLDIESAALERARNLLGARIDELKLQKGKR